MKTNARVAMTLLALWILITSLLFVSVALILLTHSVHYANGAMYVKPVETSAETRIIGGFSFGD